MNNGILIHNLDHEQRFIDLLGYELIGPDNSNRWIIKDESEIVGFIQYKKLVNKSKKNPAIYGYVTEINSKDILYKCVRKNNNEFIKFLYDFDVKRKSGQLDHIEISINNSISIDIWSNKQHIDFKIDNNGLFLSFPSTTDNFNIKEVVEYKNSDMNKEYLYQITYSKKNQSNFKTTLEISGRSNKYLQHIGQIELYELSWIDNKLRESKSCNVLGTVEEMLVRHEMGIESFKHFRFLINQILPFKKEIFLSFLSEEMIKKFNLYEFVPDLVEKNKVKKNR